MLGILLLQGRGVVLAVFPSKVHFPVSANWLKIKKQKTPILQKDPKGGLILRVGLNVAALLKIVSLLAF